MPVLKGHIDENTARIFFVIFVLSEGMNLKLTHTKLQLLVSASRCLWSWSYHANKVL